MKRLITFLLTVVMILSLAACGEQDHPCAGIYNAVSCEAMGMELGCEGEWLELKGNGRGTIFLVGEEYKCSWTLEGENFVLKNRGDEFHGVLHNGIITLDFGDMVYVYLMDPVTDEEGNVRGHVHVWTEADCENAKFCSDCGAVEGEALGHDATEANYQDPSLCNRCGVTLAEVLQPDMEKYGITEFMEEGVIYPYATATYEDGGEHETTGELQILSYEVFKSAEGYPEKEGYVWHVVQVQADFFDQNAQSWGMDVGLCYEDYYNIVLSDDTYAYDEETGFSSRMVSFHGEELPIYFKDIGGWSGWKVMDGRYQDRYSLTRAWQVPEGYDGSVIGFFNEYAVSWDDSHIYQVYDPAQFWLFRLNGKVDETTSADDSIVGTYSLYAMEDSGEYIDNDTLVKAELNGLVVITFHEDGTGIMKAYDEEVAFTYDDTRITDAEGFVYAYALTEDMLELYVEEGMIFYCQKDG